MLHLICGSFLGVISEKREMEEATEKLFFSNCCKETSSNFSNTCLMMLFLGKWSRLEVKRDSDSGRDGSSLDKDPKITEQIPHILLFISSFE